MHPDMQKAIDLIDHQIAELQRAKRILIEAFGEKTTQKDSGISPSLLFPHGTKGTRRQAILKLFQEEAPLSRAEVVKKSGIPLGTVSTILNDKTTFRNKDGKWYLVETIKEEKETQENQEK